MHDDDLPPVEFRLLLVEDEELIRDIVSVMLRRFGFELVGAASGEEALAKAEETRFDAVLLDLGLPGMSGLDCLAALLKRDPGCRVIVASGYSDSATNDNLLRLGAKAFVAKPFDFHHLSNVLRGVITA